MDVKKYKVILSERDGLCLPLGNTNSKDFVVDFKFYEKLSELVELARKYFTGLEVPSEVCSMNDLNSYREDFKSKLKEVNESYKR